MVGQTIYIYERNTYMLKLTYPSLALETCNKDIIQYKQYQCYAPSVMWVDRVHRFLLLVVSVNCVLWCVYLWYLAGCENEAGELYIKGPNMFQMYWNKPQATKETFTADGWFKTGKTFSQRSASSVSKYTIITSIALTVRLGSLFKFSIIFIVIFVLISSTSCT